MTSCRKNGAAVVFDLYGTLVDEAPRSEWTHMTGELADALGAEREPFARLWLDTYGQRVTGSWEQNVRAILSGVGAAWDAMRYETARTLRRSFVERGLTPRPDADDTLGELRRRGYKLGLMTECGDDVPVLWPTLAISRHFDAAVYTCEVGQRKPSPILYDLICERLDVSPRDCAYVGDGGGYELAGAARAGMRPILIAVAHAEWLHGEAREWTGERVRSLCDLLSLL